MGFVKVIKNKPYYKRFQVKYRRRREGKTDYYARKRLVTQDMNKYSSPKYRLVVRLTNKDIVTQLTYAQLSGDVVVAAAYAHELPRYGVPVGLTNYASAYCTGLLLARRHLKNLGLDSMYEGAAAVNGEEFHVEANGDGRRPFKALLDVGLARTTTGARVFAAMKGAADGGLDVPHSAKRFVGFSGENLNTQVLRAHIFGGHVAQYMRHLKEQANGSFEKQFSKYVAAGIGADDIEGMYAKAHAAIRADPSHTKKAAKENPDRAHNKKRQTRKNYAQRKNRVKQILAARAAAAVAAQ
jgi:large subunit ribosomal protein L5e